MSYVERVSERVSETTSETGSRPSVRQTHPFHSSVYRHHPSLSDRGSYRTRRRGPPAGVYSIVNVSESGIKDLRGVVCAADALTLFVREEFDAAARTALADAEHLRAPLGDRLDEALGRVGAVLPADAIGDELCPLAKRGARLDVDEIAIVDDPHRIDVDALAVMDPALGVGAGVVGVNTAVGKFLPRSVVFAHGLVVATHPDRRPSAGRILADGIGVSLFYTKSYYTVKPLLRRKERGRYECQEQPDRWRVSRYRGQIVASRQRQAVCDGYDGCRRAGDHQAMGSRTALGPRGSGRGRERASGCQSSSVVDRRLTTRTALFSNVLLSCVRDPPNPRFCAHLFTFQEISRFKIGKTGVNALSRHIQGFCEIGRHQDRLICEHELTQNLNFTHCWLPSSHNTPLLVTPKSIIRLGKDAMKKPTASKKLSRWHLSPRICEPLAGHVGLAKTNRPAGKCRPASGSYAGQPMQANERSWDKSPGIGGFVEAYQDPETGQFILSGSKSIHEEIRAHATIDLEASR